MIAAEADCWAFEAEALAWDALSAALSTISSK